MRRWPVLIALSLGIAFSHAHADDFQDQARAAYEKIDRVSVECNKLIIEGDLAGANAKLLAVFPEKTRTPAESFLLGNLLFEVDRKLAYSLHKAAAEAVPDNPVVTWEWALEQHRAGEYEGAIKSYQRYSAANPESAAAYALQADCLLRLNRVDGAVKAWKQSESARNGTIEQMESLVCAVNREEVPFARRAQLLAKATRMADAEAASELISLDCAFPFDWWNHGPHESYLEHDLPAVLAALKLEPDDVRVRAMHCAAECARADGEDPEAIRTILKKHKLLIDAENTLPANPGLLSVILGTANDAKLLDEKMMMALGPKVEAMATGSHDVRAWNAASLFVDAAEPDAKLTFARQAWKETKDVHFAEAVLLLKQEQGKLAGDDAELLAALKQFPESCQVQRVNVQVAAQEKKLTRDMLAAAAKAEFRHFSSFVAPATVVNRPRAGYLRGYFRLMTDMDSTKDPAIK